MIELFNTTIVPANTDEIKYQRLDAGIIYTRREKIILKYNFAILIIELILVTRELRKFPLMQSNQESVQ